MVAGEASRKCPDEAKLSKELGVVLATMLLVFADQHLSTLVLPSSALGLVDSSVEKSALRPSVILTSRIMLGMGGGRRCGI